MNKGTYYAVAGADALGVYTNVSWAKNIAGYIRNPEIIGCKSLIQAFNTARDIYNEYQLANNADASFYGDSTDIDINRVLFKSEIIKLNKLE